MNITEPAAPAITSEAIDLLVGPNRVHRSVYTDPGIFEAEMRRVFGQAWIYAAHESQIPRAGDFITTTLAGHPVVVARQAGGAIGVLYNRCAHRGAIVEARSKGSARSFQCSHHGWAYRTDGTLEAVPAAAGYAESGFDVSAGAPGMQALPRVDIYRGFVFASLASAGPGLESFLGPVARMLDDMVDRSPDGEIEIAGGSFQLLHRSNWKIYLENLQDGVHALPTHRSTFEPARQAMREATRPLSRMQAEAVAANSQPPRAMARLKVQCHPYGHSEMLAFRRSRIESPEYAAYERALAERLGTQRAAEVFDTDRHNAVIYPSLTVQPSFMQLRRVVPLRADLTRLDVWILRLKGVPEWLNRRNIAYANAIHSPASVVRADDMENFERTQRGLQNEAVPWVSQHRGYGGEPTPSGPSHAMSERYVRNQFAAWRDYMRTGS